MESPESSVATFKPFERVVTLVSGTLYKDCKTRKKLNNIIIIALTTVSQIVQTGMTYTAVCKNSHLLLFALIARVNSQQSRTKSTIARRK